MNKKTNNHTHLESPYTGTPFDAAETLLEIQSRLRGSEYPDEGSDLKVQTIDALSNLGLMLDGLGYTAVIGNRLTDDDIQIVRLYFEELKELISERDKEHSAIWNLAFHGHPDLPSPWQVNPNTGGADD